MIYSGMWSEALSPKPPQEKWGSLEGIVMNSPGNYQIVNITII
jgi:hypothetical protein